MNKGEYRSWAMFSSCLMAVGLTSLGLAVMFCCFKEMEGQLIGCLVLAGIGSVLFFIGLKVYRWDYRERHKYLPKKVDQSLDYTFYLTTENGRVEVTDFEQIKTALSTMNMELKGKALIEIEPPMGGIKSFDNEYSAEDDYFYTYMLNERFDGEGYFILISRTLQVALDDLRQLYFKRKQIDVSGYNCKETGWQR